MTVRVTTLKGSGAGAYYVDGPADYYLQPGEPRGRWLGDAAKVLGLSGEVADGHFLALMAGVDPHRPDHYLGGRYAEKSVRGFDVTASAPKSVSVLFALGDIGVRREVLAAHDDAVTALAGWIERHSHTRYRIGGEVAVVDTRGIVAAAFRQHTSRALDPQLHTHLVIPNRVMSPDGRWLALDARLIKLDQQSLSAIYHAGLRTELTRRLGVRWELPEHGIAEIRDVPSDVTAEFSTRTADVRRRAEDKLDRFVETMSREPTPRERWMLEREAVIDSRPSKVHSVDAQALHAGWAEQARQLGHEPAALVADALERVGERRGIDAATRNLMIERTIAAMSEKQSTWRPTQLHRELAAVVPTDTAATAEQLVGWLDRVVDEIASTRCVDVSKPIPPNSLLRRDGRPITESVADRALTTQVILDQEQSLIDWVDRRLVHDGPDDPTAVARSPRALDVGQAAAASAIAGDADLVLVVGPAGTGKTTALAPAVAQIRAAGRVVFGVAPSATAADVLAQETGVAADTLDKLLIEHRLTRPPGPRYDLPAGATVIVDEAGMMPTAKLAELADLADAKGWRIALVGDPMQFSAVGRGGMFGLLVDTFGAIELEGVHRFENEWERDASLRLRRGDITVAGLYEEHGRLYGGTVSQMERKSVDRWWELRSAGKPALLMTPTNEAAQRLNERCQQKRIAAGDVDGAGWGVQAGQYTVFLGDEIATRQNDRRLVTDRGVTVKNRARWTVEGIGNNGELLVTSSAGTIELPPGYVSDHVDLAYATTGMGGQGRTVKGGLVFGDGAMDLRNLYVPMSRGTETNEAFLVTVGEETALDVFVRAMSADWIDLPALQRHAELNNTEVRRPGLLDSAQLRSLIEERFALTTVIRDAETRLWHATRERTTAEKERPKIDAALVASQAKLDKADEDIRRFNRPLHRGRHAVELQNAFYARVVEPQGIIVLQLRLAEIDRQIANSTSAMASAEKVLATRPQLEGAVAEIDRRLDVDLDIRTRVARSKQPSAITEVLGDRPTHEVAAHEWDHAAGRLAQHQEAFGIDSGLGPTPGWRDESAFAQSYSEIERHVPHLPEPGRHIEIESIGIEL